MLKASGYLVSTLSVLLLGIPSLKSAFEQPFTAACLILGMITSVVGMLLRWLSFRADEKPAKPETPTEMAADVRRRVASGSRAR